jgi:hypothetical protein
MVIFNRTVAAVAEGEVGLSPLNEMLKYKT